MLLKVVMCHSFQTTADHSHRAALTSDALRIELCWGICWTCPEYLHGVLGPQILCRAVLKMWLYESFWVQCFICLQMFQLFSALYKCLRPEMLQWTAKVGIVWWIPCLFCGSFEMYDFAVLLDWCQCWSLCHFWLAVELQEPWDSSKSST